MTRNESTNDNDRRSVLTPDDLDFTTDSRVAEIDDGRFVISPGDDTPSVDGDTDDEQVREQTDLTDGPLDEHAVRRWLQESLLESDVHYGFDLTVKADDQVARQRLLSDDVTVMFETLLTWYAQRVSQGAAVEEVLGILLQESNVPIRYPPEALAALARTHDLDGDDTIAALMAAVEDDGGVVFPR